MDARFFYSPDLLNLFVRIRSKFVLVIILIVLLRIPFHLLAGGSGLNVALVVNQASSNSVALGNYYAEKRSIPPENILFINWPGEAISWSKSQFETNLLSPLTSMISTRQLTNQIWIVALSMDIPFSVSGTDNVNSTTSALFYGFKGMNWPDQISSTNSYAGSESPFVALRPASAPNQSYLATMITASNLTRAMRLVDQGVTSDGTFPREPVLLVKTTDPLRNIRYHAFDNTVFNNRLRGYGLCIRTNLNSLWGQTNLLGCVMGLGYFSVPQGTFSPGAMADSLTSYGGAIFGPNTQTTLLAFIDAGASGSYGTVTEPQPLPEKFPDPQNYFYQSRGFTLAECYYQSLTNPHQGLIVGEPLAAPFARGGSGSWLALPTNAILRNVTNLTATFSSADPLVRFQQVDLFVDGKFHSTVTNLPLPAGNQFVVKLKGHTVATVVPTNATLASAAMLLAGTLNAPSNSLLTKVGATLHGDRIELKYLSPMDYNMGWEIIDDSAPESSSRKYRAVRLSPPVNGVMTNIVFDSRGAIEFEIRPLVINPFVVQASTNLINWRSIAASSTGDPMTLSDPFARYYRSRFYRLAPASALTLSTRPKLVTLGTSPSKGFQLYVESSIGSPYVIQISNDLISWSSVLTNATGGPMTYSDGDAFGAGTRFYRTQSDTPSPYLPVAITASNSIGSKLLSIQDPLRMPAVIFSSTNAIDWMPVYTNLSPRDITISVTSSKGSAPTLNSFLHTARSGFMESTAYGFRQCSVKGMVQAGASLSLAVTKTNGAVTVVSFTNQNPAAMIGAITRDFVAMINASSSLAGDDGLVAEDVVPGFMGLVTFNLRARSPGLAAAGIQIRFSSTGMLVTSPAFTMALNQNMSDLLPRNHLYVTAGYTNLTVAFPFDTTQLSDGYHELAAVAYEGSHVRTQTRCTTRVRISNTPLGGTINITNAADTASVRTNLQVYVTGNTNSINSIRLFSTGGEQMATSNLASTVFSVSGSALGIGLHPFYAILGTTNGQAFRTETVFVRLISP